MPNDRRLIARLRAENAVLRALVVELGGTPPPSPSDSAAVEQCPPPRLATLAQLAQQGL